MAAPDPQSIAAQGIRFPPLHIAEQGLVASLPSAEVVCAGVASLTTTIALARSSAESAAAVLTSDLAECAVTSSYATADLSDVPLYEARRDCPL